MSLHYLRFVPYGTIDLSIPVGVLFTPLHLMQKELRPSALKISGKKAGVTLAYLPTTVA